jgi:hypothetical protein
LEPNAVLDKPKPTAPSVSAAALVKPGQGEEQPPLRAVRTDILKNCRKPLFGGELDEGVRAEEP